MSQPTTSDEWLTERPRAPLGWRLVGWVVVALAAAFWIWVLFLWITVPANGADVWGYRIGTVVGTFGIAMLLRWAWVRLRPAVHRPAFWSPAIVVIAAIVAVAPTVQDLQPIRERTIASYVVPADGFTYQRDDADLPLLQQTIAAASIQPGVITNMDLYLAIRGGQRVGVVEVLAIRGSNASSKSFWDDIANSVGPSQNRKDTTLEGQAAVEFTDNGGTQGLFWHIDNLAITVGAPDRSTVSDIAGSLIRAARGQPGAS